ncbi:hypothetical protein [Conexibacter sp. SYSU D00693]|uniref:hypothetical protein n=1 Tax=Conexibacter sp. SYSU D00693 TaxID=2812560 RepID=UPI00196A3E05|nr:hypothetical protein [Conexibacter sp. SYSU D00693]
MPAAIAAAVVALLVALLAGARRAFSGAHAFQGAIIHTPTDDTGIDADGAVRSVQGADIIVPARAIEGMWTPENLERLARTYWRSLSRFTFGLVRVVYTPGERYVVLLHPRLRLLTFRKPEYEMDECAGIVRWRIQKGLLVAPRGREGDGYLELEVQRHDYPDWDKVRIHVEVEVANFYPAIASRLGRWVYANTQSRIHVIACFFFLRSLVRRELERSEVGQFAGPLTVDEAPAPSRERAHAPDQRIAS